MYLKSSLAASILISFILSTSAWAQFGPMPTGQAQPHFDLSAQEIPIQAATAHTPAVSLQMMSVSVTGAASSSAGAESILRNLTPEQLGNTVVVSEDAEVEADLTRIFQGPKSFDVKSVPAFMPYGDLANNRGARELIRKSPLGRIWDQAAAWEKTKQSRIGLGIAERVRYIAAPQRRLDAVYFVLGFGLSARGWLYIAADPLTHSQAYIQASLGNIADLAFSRGLSAFTMIPNRFSILTNWTTTKLRQVTGQDMSIQPTVGWRIAGNLITQAGINATVKLISALDPQNVFLTPKNITPILFASAMATSTDFFVQKTYGVLGEIQFESNSDLVMTDFLLRRTAAVLGLTTSIFAQSKTLLTFKMTAPVVYAWIAQGVTIATWVVLAQNLRAISHFAETSKLLKLYARFEESVFQIPSRAIGGIFRPEPCISLFGPQF